MKKLYYVLNGDNEMGEMKYYCVWTNYDGEHVETFNEKNELKIFIINLLKINIQHLNTLLI